MLITVPISFDEAAAYVNQHHRHHIAPRGHKFSVAASDGTQIVGVAIVGRPVARGLQDGWTLEVLRCCTNGARNACSYLYRVCWRIARSFGYRRLITYTLNSEQGSSLRGAGFKLIGQAGGGSWSVPSRPRVDKHPLQMKLRWEVTA